MKHALCFAAAAMLAITGCSKKDDPTGPGSGPNYGSGTITVNSGAGNLSFSGAGVFPPSTAGTVLAILDTARHEMLIVGYQLVSATNLNIVALSFHAHEPLSAGELPVGDSTSFFVAYNINLSDTAAAYYQSTSGSIVITSVSGTTVTGTFSGEGETSAGGTADFTGSFSVTYVVGQPPFDLEERPVRLMRFRR